MTKNKKMILSIMLICSLIFGSIGFTQSQTSTSYVPPLDQVGLSQWCVYREKCLRDNLKLVDERKCPQEKETIKNMINTCIRENKKLIVNLSFDLFNGCQCWYYSIK